MQRKIPAVLMRGGTSKGIVFQAKDLPEDPDIRDRVILAAYGSPDPNRRQIDGIGGALSVTSKVAIVSPSEDAANDIVYHFGQVSIDRPLVDYKGTCGNIAAAVAAFAVEEGFVKADEPVTRVRILQKNTGKQILADVPVANGSFCENGDYAIDGVPGTGGKITIRYVDPGGSVTGNLFPTGNRADTFEVPGVGSVMATIIDVGNPWVLVPAADLGLTGTEIDEIDRSEKIRCDLEAVRGLAAVKIGLVKTPEEATLRSQAIPKIGFFSKPQSYDTLKGNRILASDVDVVSRVMSMGMLHKSMAVSFPMAVAGAAAIAGTTVSEALGRAGWRQLSLRLGHPGGIFDVEATVEKQGDTDVLKEAAYGRTARRLMEGFIRVPEKFFSR